ncbi:MAG: hypothetical protein LBQ96_03745 [Fusobacteriaceae bacterium]|jgi:hypothetical protein|nr:hypothetical protein [Fusobacteriaceae bacterium]
MKEKGKKVIKAFEEPMLAEEMLRVMSYMTDHGHIFPSWEDICVATESFGDCRGKGRRQTLSLVKAGGRI